MNFRPHPLLSHPHLMTVFPRFWPRGRLLEGLPSQARLFTVAPQTQLLGYCHWQHDPKQHGTVVLVHGLEGCSESHYMHGIARKTWLAGFNVIRLNQRNCGGTEHLTPTLYHSGLSQDIRAVLIELLAHDGLGTIWAIGYSMGGNLVLKMAGEVQSELAALRGVLAVCPNIDPAACVSALERPTNWAYQRHFLKHLKARLYRKAVLFPGKFDCSRLARIRTLREFDETYTAPDGGYKSADDYYDRVGSRHVLAVVQVPTVIITAQDDPFIPYRMFECAAIKTNPWIRLWAPTHGGHCGFVQRPRFDEDVYWAENRLVEHIVKEAHGPGIAGGRDA